MKDIRKLEDVELSDASLLQSYYNHFLNGDIYEAHRLIEINESLKSKVLNEDNLNRLVDGIIKLENNYYNGVEDFLKIKKDIFQLNINDLIKLDEFDENKKYYVNNFVTYLGDIYYCFKDAPTGTYPLERGYWLYLGLKGRPSPDNLAIKYKGLWESNLEYNKFDTVVYKNQIYIARKDKVISTPTTIDDWSAELKIDGNPFIFNNSSNNVINRVIDIEDSWHSKVLNYEAYDKSEQNILIGKNLFYLHDYALVEESRGYYTYIYHFEVKKNTEYTLSLHTTSDKFKNNYSTVFFNNDELHTFNKVNFDEPSTITSSEDGYIFVRFRISIRAIEDHRENIINHIKYGYTFIQIEEGTQATEYEPYKIISPNPNQPQEIKSKTINTIKIVGKNIANPDLWGIDRNDGTYLVKSQSYIYENIFNFKQLAISCDIKGLSSDNNFKIVINYKDGTYDESRLYENKQKWESIYLISDALKQIKNISFSYKTDNILFRNFQIEVNNEVTNYEFYNGTDYNLTKSITLRGIKDSNWNKIFDDERYNCDILMKKNGKWGIERRIQHYVFDGNEVFNLHKKLNNGINEYICSSIKYPISRYYVNLFCNYLPYPVNNYNYNGEKVILGNKTQLLFFYLNNNEFPNREYIKSWIKKCKDSNNPLTIDYVLNEPFFEVLPSQDQKTLNHLITLYPRTIMTCDGVIQELKYKTPPLENITTGTILFSAF